MGDRKVMPAHLEYARKQLQDTRDKMSTLASSLLDENPPSKDTLLGLYITAKPENFRELRAEDRGLVEDNDELAEQAARFLFNADVPNVNRALYYLRNVVSATGVQLRVEILQRLGRNILQKKVRQLALAGTHPPLPETVFLFVGALLDKGTEKDRKEAGHMLQTFRGCDKAEALQARLLLQEGKEGEAEAILLSLARKKNPEGCAIYARFLRAKPELSEGQHKVLLRMYRDLAGTGNEESLYYYGLELLGSESDQKIKQGRKYVKKSATLGFPLAIFKMGMLYMHEHKPERALEAIWFAATLGVAAAIYEMANIFRLGRLGVRPDKYLAFCFYKKAAEHPEASAAYFLDLAVCYQRGIGCMVDPKKADETNQEAASRGDIEGCYRVAKACLRNKAPETAAILLRKAADANHRDGMVALATMFLDGHRDVCEGREEALYLLREAAKRGSEAAKTYLKGLEKPE